MASWERNAKQTERQMKIRQTGLGWTHTHREREREKNKQKREIISPTEWTKRAI